jgi:hypothetical protein
VSDPVADAIDLLKQTLPEPFLPPQYPGTGPFREFLGRWHTTFQNFEMSSGEFYANFEECLAKSRIPNLRVTRTLWRERGFMSSQRIYLRVKRHDLYFEVCASPFGTSFFFSWWFFRKITIVEKLLSFPFGWLIFFPITLPWAMLFGTNTFYSYDTAEVFEEIVHGCVQQVIDTMTTEKGLRALTEAERKPMLSRFFKR